MNADDVADELAPGLMVGEYRIDGMLGRGGMATVYAAIHPVIGKRAAIKVVNRRLLGDSEAVARFVHEAQAVNRINHPNIVDVFSIGTLADGRPYFVMEWLQGESLGARLQRGPLSPDEATDLLNQLCLALEAVHEAGIVHRDLKPDNIFLVPLRGRALPIAKLLDFGVAKLAGNQGMNRVTRTGMAVGTPAYVSPEQARGVEIDQRSDIYTLGVIAYEVLTGKLPFDGESALDVMMLHVQALPPSVRDSSPDVPQIFDDLISAMLAKSPQARPTLGDIRTVLEPLGTDSTALPRASSSLPIPVRNSASLAATLSTERLPARRMLPGTLVLLAAIAGIAMAIVMVIYTGADEPRTKPPARSAPSIAADAALPAETSFDGAVESRESWLVLRMTTNEVTVAIDGVTIVDPRDGSVVPIAEPGTHVVTARAAGHHPLRKTIEISAGETAEVSIALQAIERRRKPRARKPTPPKHQGDNYTLDPFNKGTR